MRKLLSALIVLPVLVGCPKGETAENPPAETKKSRLGESCARSADCEAALRCVGLQCVADDGTAPAAPATAPATPAPAPKGPTAIVAAPAAAQPLVAVAPPAPVATETAVVTTPPPPASGIAAAAPKTEPAAAEPPPKPKPVVDRSMIPADKKYQDCKEIRPVLGGDDTTAEGALYRVFEALLMENDDTSFETFYGLVDGRFQNRKSARNYWFAAARKNGGTIFHRLVFGPKNPAYVVCQTRSEGDQAVRIFVGKSPPVGSNPPFVLHPVDGHYRLKNFTPF